MRPNFFTLTLKMLSVFECQSKMHRLTYKSHIIDCIREFCAYAIGLIFG